MKLVEKMLDPCSPCVCSGAPCEQCMFGYRSKEDNHKAMKALLLAFEAGERPGGWRCAETYLLYHNDWRSYLGEVTGNKKQVYTRCSEELNDKVVELMEDYEKLVEKAKGYGLDIRLYDESETLVLYFHDDYPDTLLVDKKLSSLRRVESIKGMVHYRDGRKVPILSIRVDDKGRSEIVTRTGVLTNLIDDYNFDRVEMFDVEQSPDKYSHLLN